MLVDVNTLLEQDEYKESYPPMREVVCCKSYHPKCH
ncbi:unnamed protein product [Musa acuminata subsp. malaccensis]|uniref:(wild Malaysian banana) hypothetical protein n=1 Tax=Musa acuminata subsp. malaccensis TaxID=214687 RepID=A0A804KC94_MUSAM|nr:unnamed protein product [Musa acuminata subsp. malaccensis]